MIQGLRITARESGRRAVVVVRGRLVDGGPAGDLVRRVRMLLAHGSRRIVLDLSGTRLIDCAGIGQVIVCSRAAARRGAVLRVFRARAPIRKMLEMSRLQAILSGPAFNASHP